MSTGPEDQVDPVRRAEFQANEEEWTKPENWRFGMFYYSQKDTRPWVPKRSLFGRQSKVGGTPNFAKPEARLYILIVTSVLMGILLVLMVMQRMRELG